LPVPLGEWSADIDRRARTKDMKNTFSSSRQATQSASRVGKIRHALVYTPDRLNPHAAGP
jgi:hypothetical protein